MRNPFQKPETKNSGSDAGLKISPRRDNPVRSADLSDEALARAAQQSEKRAFVEIVARHQAMVCGITFGILGDFAAGEDAAQDAFLTAWRKIHDLREPHRLKAWLGQIARNTALGHLRSLRGEASYREAADQTDPAMQPDEAAASDEEAALVREALAGLPETYRLPLVLFYREGQSVRMVAESLDLSEDAVKQRLARGRDMLRDRMSGLIETVLGRTRPTAVFTMVIAVAIGALTSPAVVASTAFTAAAAAGAASASAASAGSVVTVMSTSKTSLAIAALVAVACLPLGYGARIGLESSPVVSPGGAAAAPDIGRGGKPDLSGSELYAEWRRLHDEHGTTAEAMPLLYTAISGIKDPVRRRVFRAAQIAEWAEVAPGAGLAFFLEDGRDSGQRNQFFSEWLRRDAPAAVDALMMSGRGWEDVARKALVEIAKRVPGRVAEIAARIPKSDNHWTSEVADAFAVIAAGGLAEARSAAEQMTGVNREQALAGVAKAWAKTDADAAIAWAKGLPEGVDHNEIVRAALVGISSARPADALDRVKSIPPGGKQGYFATTTGARVLSEAARSDYDATVAWIAANPAQLGREDMMGIAGAVTDRLNADPAAFLSRHLADGSLTAMMPAIGSAVLNQAGGQRAAIWEWIKTQPDSTEIQQLRREVLNSAGYQDPDLALKLVADFPATPEGDAMTIAAASSLMNGGQMLHRLDDLLVRTPERLRQPLLDAAFQSLRGDNLDDPAKWLSRLAQAPAEKAANYSAQVGAAWGALAPEEAVGWATSLPAGEARTAALNSVAEAWIARDAYGASDWIAGLPRGAEKDAAASSLARAIAADSPAEAWQWSLAISDPAIRLGSAMHTLGSVQKRDPAAAKEWLEASPFTGQEKAGMLEQLNERNP